MFNATTIHHQFRLDSGTQQANNQEKTETLNAPFYPEVLHEPRLEDIDSLLKEMRSAVHPNNNLVALDQISILDTQVSCLSEEASLDTNTQAYVEYQLFHKPYTLPSLSALKPHHTDTQFDLIGTEESDSVSLESEKEFVLSAKTPPTTTVRAQDILKEAFFSDQYVSHLSEDDFKAFKDDEFFKELEGESGSFIKTPELNIIYLSDQQKKEILDTERRNMEARLNQALPYTEFFEKQKHEFAALELS